MTLRKPRYKYKVNMETYKNNRQSEIMFGSRIGQGYFVAEKFRPGWLNSTMDAVLGNEFDFHLHISKTHYERY